MWRVASILRERSTVASATATAAKARARAASTATATTTATTTAAAAGGGGVSNGSSFLRSPLKSSPRACAHLPFSTAAATTGPTDSITVQLDYYLSPQFAGVASAVVNDLYAKHGIQNLNLLPTCLPGEEQGRVRQHLNDNPSHVAVGTVEQNIFTPTLAANPHLRTTAVAAMFHHSPLCVAFLKDAPSPRVIGAHEDTVELLQRLFPNDKVIASPRASKLTDLLINGSVTGIQAYTTTEVPTIERMLRDDPALAGKKLEVTVLEGMASGSAGGGVAGGATKLGYGQMVFTGDECLSGDDDRRDVVKAFLQATFEGWEHAIRHPELAAEQVLEAQKRLLDVNSTADGELGDVDHWYRGSSNETQREYDVEMTRLCNDQVKGTFQADRYGVIDVDRWDEANRWLLGDGYKGDNYAIDPAVWTPPAQMLGGNQLAHRLLGEAKSSAVHFEQTYGRRPSLAVVTVGELKRYAHGTRRLEIYSDASRSWFAKSEVGRANNFDVTEINMDGATTTTESLLSELYMLQKDDSVDGIQLMWPMPEHIDSAKVFSAIDVAKDVDGIHYVGQLEIGNDDAHPPVTPAGAIALMEEYGVELGGKRVVVIGRSPIVGSPLAHMCRQKGAAVTVLHSKVPEATAKAYVENADVVLCCAGEPGLIPAEWISKDAAVINVGTTFVEELDRLVSDVDGDLAKRGCKFSPVPGGIGPLSSPMLFRNVAKAAWAQMSRGKTAALSNGWVCEQEKLRKTYHFDTYSEALEAARKVDEMSTIMDHHANMKFNHACVHGVDLELEFFTWEASRLTEKDYDATMAVDMLLAADQIQMKNYTYDLKEDIIAKHPASPRGSSKVLHVDGSGKVTYHNNFSDIFASLIEGSHLVFNDSKVLDARLFVSGNGLEKTELMILDLGNVDVDAKCSETRLRAMIRTDAAKAGQTFTELGDNQQVVIDEVIGEWLEDEKSDGNGLECWVRIQSDASIEDFLKSAGSVPIPPYLHRAAEDSDKEAYNNLYAVEAGSVAAPTAGLHFTKPVLDEIGSDNCSYLSLHVGAGTFKPVLVEDARDHEMHAEVFSVSVREIRNIIGALEAGKSLTVVGTTSTRTLESLFWCGVKRIRGLEAVGSDGGIDANHRLEVGQMEWIPLLVGEGRTISRVTALKALIEGRDDAEVLSGKTSLMIFPPMYDFQVVDNLVTNFHAPDSTLMLLVSGFLKDSKGNKIRQIYEDAQENGYRFLSYGDVCLFSKPESK